MNSKQAAFLSAVAVFLLLGVYGASLLSPGDDFEPGKLRVVATFYPLHYFAQQVGGDRADVKSLIPFNSEPHAWDPAPGDIIMVDKAQVLIYNGAGLEPWVPRLLDTLQHRDSMVVVEAAGGLLIDNWSGPVRDPHVWLDPLLARQQVGKIGEAFARADPANAGYYADRTGELQARLDALNAEFVQGLENRTRNVIVTTHEGFDWLARRYNFTAEAVLGLEPNQQPSAHKIAEIADLVNGNGLSAVFGEPVYDDRYMQTIAREVRRQTGRDVQVLVLDGIHGRSGPHAGMDYFEIQRDNLRNLRIGLGVV